MDSTSTEVTPFSYEILDLEAAKISDLVLAVQHRCVDGNEGIEAGKELLGWAERFSRDGKPQEAEFVYLHAICIFEKHQSIDYPMTFTTLRDLAFLLMSKIHGASESASPNVPEDVSPVIQLLADVCGDATSPADSYAIEPKVA
jgi:hypothetical protein